LLIAGAMVLVIVIGRFSVRSRHERVGDSRLLPTRLDPLAACSGMT
jgi:hypothetical protein